MIASDFDEFEFYGYLLNNIPPPILEMMKAHFIEESSGLMSFERWLAHLPRNQEMIQLLLDLYNYDQLGKREKESYKIKMTVFKQKKRTNPFTDDFFDRLHQYLASSSEK